MTCQQTGLKHGQVIQTRQLRDGRQLAEISCPHCGETHWHLAPGQLVQCLSEPGAVMWVDGLGAPA